MSIDKPGAPLAGATARFSVNRHNAQFFIGNFVQFAQ